MRPECQESHQCRLRWGRWRWRRWQSQGRRERQGRWSSWSRWTWGLITQWLSYIQYNILYKVVPTSCLRQKKHLAISAPAKTAPPVQIAWPRQPPRMTPTWRQMLWFSFLTPRTTSLMPARTMVASWDRSPHSAMKVRVKVLTNSWHKQKPFKRYGWFVLMFINHLEYLKTLLSEPGVLFASSVNGITQPTLAKISFLIFLGPRGPLRVIPPVHPSTRPPAKFLFESSSKAPPQRHRHKGTATKAPPQRAPPTKIPQTIFRQESFVSLKFEVWSLNHLADLSRLLGLVLLSGRRGGRNSKYDKKLLFAR